jgi:chorismate synthase
MKRLKINSDLVMLIIHILKNMESETTEVEGRQSARETASRVAAGAIAKKVLQKNLGKNLKLLLQSLS